MWSERTKESGMAKGSTAAKSESEASSQVGTVSEVAVIGRAMLIRGHIKSREGLYVDGEVDGTLDLGDSRLTVGPNGKVTADVSAREIDVRGAVTGDLHAGKKITIRKGGRLVGDLRTPAIVIEEGAYFKGKIEILDNVDRRGAEAAQRNVRTIAARA